MYSEWHVANTFQSYTAMIACIAYVNTHCVWLYGEIIINISLVMIYFLVIFFPQKDFF